MDELINTIIKLGGSVITVKDNPLTPDISVIERITKEIARARLDSMIIVHGGGSFGHPIAEKYRIVGGYSDPDQLIGFSKTRQAMISLNKLVIDELIRNSLPAVAIQPSACITTKKGRIFKFESEPIRRLLDLKFVPVIYGDAVLDTDLGFTILSGDQLTTHLATLFRARRIIMGVDVDGIYTTDPKINAKAKLIEYITSDELKDFLRKIGKARTTDVTGGMSGKITELISLKNRIEVKIVNARIPNRLYKALKYEKVKGTTLNLGRLL